MISLDSGVRIYLACGATDMRKGMAGLAMLVQQSLSEGSFQRCGLCLPGAAGRADQAVVARRNRIVPADQAAGTRPVRVAVGHHHGADPTQRPAIGGAARWLRVARSGTAAAAGAGRIKSAWVALGAGGDAAASVIIAVCRSIPTPCRTTRRCCKRCCGPCSGSRVSCTPRTTSCAC